MQQPHFLQVLSSASINDGILGRISMTTGCDDCRDIPKQPDAGKIRDITPWPAQVMHNGVLVARDGYCGTWMTRIIEQLKGHHEPQEEKVFHEVVSSLQNATTMVELGAYWAYYSLWFLQRFPSGRTILVEPDPNFIEIGKFNYSLNGREGTFVQAAVASQPAEPSAFRCESDSVERKIPRISVDSLVDEFGLDRIDILLADIQGAELEMLRGLENTLRKRQLSTLFLSTHDQSISGDYLTHEKCLEWIKANGGHIIAEHCVEESFSGDGLIAASFDARCKLTVAVSHNRAVNSLFGSPSVRLAAMAQHISEGASRRQ